jgi:hypothetical protein
MPTLKAIGSKNAPFDLEDLLLIGLPAQVLQIWHSDFQRRNWPWPH